MDNGIDNRGAQSQKGGSVMGMVKFLGVDPGFSKIGIGIISYLYEGEKFVSLANSIPKIESKRIEIKIRGLGDLKSFRELESCVLGNIYKLTGAPIKKTGAIALNDEFALIGIEKPMAFAGAGSGGAYIHYGYSLILRKIMELYPEERIRIFTPGMAKKNLTGVAGAKKEMIPAFIQKRFNVIPATLDEADAISIAYATAREWELGTDAFLNSLKMKIKDLSFISRATK